MDVLNKIILGIKKSAFPFAIQLDESTDVALCSQLLVFVRDVCVTENCIEEDFIFCEYLESIRKPCCLSAF